MNTLKRFMKYLKESWSWVLANFKTYLPSYLAFLFVDILSAAPWAAFGYAPGSMPEVLMSLLVGILSLIIIVNVILIEKARVKHREKEQLVYSVPTYLIYTLYSTLIILIGPGIMMMIAGMLQVPNIVMLSSAVIVGLAAALFMAMVPLASVLIDNDSVNYFKLSVKMARENALLIICYGVLTLLIEAPSWAFDLIPDWRFVLSFNLLYAFFDAVAMIVLTITSVRIFYHLKHQLNDQSQ